MFRFKLKYLFKNKQTRLILLLTICVSLCITLIGTYSYSKYRQVLDTELNTPNVELLQINQDVTNRAFYESDSKAVDASFHPAILAFISSATERGATLPDELTSYLKTLSTHPDIQSITVISFVNHSVLSTDYGFRANWGDAPDSKWMNWIDEIQKKPLVVKRRMYDGVTAVDPIELLTLARPIVLNGQVGGAVLVNLDYDRFFSKMYIHLSNYQYVYDLEGELIYPKLNLPVPLAEMNKVIAEIDVQPFAYVKVEGHAYMANQTFSNVTGWRLVSLVPMEELLRNVRMARDMMLILSLISILVGCSAMYYYNFAAFRPLKRINKLLNPGQKTLKAGDLHDLEPVIGKLIGDFYSKSLVAERSLPELRSKFMQDVLTRSIGSQEISTKWDHFFHDWSVKPLTVIIISIDRYWQWASEYQEEDQMLLKYALNNIVLETLDASSWRTVSIAFERDAFAVLLQAKEAKLDSLPLDAQKIIRTVTEFLNLSVSIGIGSEVMDITQVTQSYAQAKEALSYRLYEGYQQIWEFAVVEGLLDEQAQALDESWTVEMIQSLRSPDKEANLQWISRWVEEIRKKKLQPHKVYTAADDLLEGLLSFVKNNGLKPPLELADYTWHQVTTLKLADIEKRLSTIVVQLSEQLDKRRLSKEYLLVQSMISFMENHLHLNIGLQDIADHISMGISSVSTMFKEETGSTIYDYLTTMRIEKACELLRDSQLKMAAIALQVGYQNENSFIRAFRKVKSVTPGKYREISKIANGYADPPKPRHSGEIEDSPED